MVREIRDLEYEAECKRQKRVDRRIRGNKITIKGSDIKQTSADYAHRLLAFFVKL